MIINQIMNNNNKKCNGNFLFGSDHDLIYSNIDGDKDNKIGITFNTFNRVETYFKCKEFVSNTFLNNKDDGVISTLSRARYNLAKYILLQECSETLIKQLKIQYRKNYIYITTRPISHNIMGDKSDIISKKLIYNSEKDEECIKRDFATSTVTILIGIESILKSIDIAVPYNRIKIYQNKCDLEETKKINIGKEYELFFNYRNHLILFEQDKIKKIIINVHYRLLDRCVSSKSHDSPDIIGTLDDGVYINLILELKKNLSQEIIIGGDFNSTLKNEIGRKLNIYNKDKSPNYINQRWEYDRIIIYTEQNFKEHIGLFRFNSLLSDIYVSKSKFTVLDINSYDRIYHFEKKEKLENLDILDFLINKYDKMFITNLFKNISVFNTNRTLVLFNKIIDFLNIYIIDLRQLCLDYKNLQYIYILYNILTKYKSQYNFVNIIDIDHIIFLNYVFYLIYNDLYRSLIKIEFNLEEFLKIKSIEFTIENYKLNCIYNNINIFNIIKKLSTKNIDNIPSNYYIFNLIIYNISPDFSMKSIVVEQKPIEYILKKTVIKSEPIYINRREYNDDVDSEDDIGDILENTMDDITTEIEKKSDKIIYMEKLSNFKSEKPDIEIILQNIKKIAYEPIVVENVVSILNYNNQFINKILLLIDNLIIDIANYYNKYHLKSSEKILKKIKKLNIKQNIINYNNIIYKDIIIEEFFIYDENCKHFSIDEYTKHLCAFIDEVDTFNKCVCKGTLLTETNTIEVEELKTKVEQIKNSLQQKVDENKQQYETIIINLGNNDLSLFVLLRIIYNNISECDLKNFVYVIESIKSYISLDIYDIYYKYYNIILKYIESVNEINKKTEKYNKEIKIEEINFTIKRELNLKYSKIIAVYINILNNIDNIDRILFQINMKISDLCNTFDILNGGFFSNNFKYKYLKYKNKYLKLNIT